MEVWCCCQRAGTCIGCLIEKSVKLDYGMEGLAHLVRFVEMVDEAEARDALTDMVHQFCYRAVKDDILQMHTGGLSALESAFRVLGYADPMPCPDMECAEEGCGEEVTCGMPTATGYKRTCGTHFRDALGPAGA